MWQLTQRDRVGLSWRTELAASILCHLDHIDVVEVIIDDYLKQPLDKLRSLKLLESQVDVIYHSVSLGLASSLPVPQKNLDKLARVFDYLTPTCWSEHLAFVRAGNIEIGHLAAPPRTIATIEGALANLARVKKTVGSLPVLENIATLLEPPGAFMSEGEWTTKILQASNTKLLLDLNNLYSNAINFGVDPILYLHSFPLHLVQIVHLSGGKWIDEPAGFSGKRLLDDHIHDVPDPVFELLDVLARTVEQPLAVIIERDGNYPPFPQLLQEIQRAKRILREARSHECTVV
ncbi:DUF692 domain-containing protein [Candidatus Berkiella aquae]|uniref:DUF692 domain-containing protein n=1 Tax=Candidatus Berkiella aquae TaxID=295108 RepID=A0A0Q9YMF8_9GAMM|nr:DUF692 family multinuclear iron-containing protein [Candidatus Berkiella aquae]MCS5709886.1 DUF692 domain-containing protein [Candidatus Berkiella aquae]